MHAFVRNAFGFTYLYFTRPRAAVAPRRVEAYVQ
jgi:hypothetical protein